VEASRVSGNPELNEVLYCPLRQMGQGTRAVPDRSFRHIFIADRAALAQFERSHIWNFVPLADGSGCYATFLRADRGDAQRSRVNLAASWAMSRA